MASNVHNFDTNMQYSCKMEKHSIIVHAVEFLNEGQTRKKQRKLKNTNTNTVFSSVVCRDVANVITTSYMFLY